MSKHFADKEFECRCGQPTCDAPKQPNALLIERLEKMREIYKLPLIINSGYRCARHNSLSGGVKDSPHLTGLAADLLCNSSTERFHMIAAALGAGFKRIGIGKTFLHVDVDTSKAFEVCWLY